MINNNFLQVIRDQAFEGLSLLEFLHLPNNFIRHLPQNVFHPLEKIVWIDLSNNDISSLPENAFRSNTKLKGLDLRKNPLTKIILPAGNPIRSIDYLLLNDCDQLKEVKLAIDVLNITLENSAVETLKISGSVQSIRAGNSPLTNLDLHGATLNVSFLSDILCKSRSLKQLDLSSTSLDTIQLSSGDLYFDCLLPNLKILKLSNNNIETLPMGSPLFGSKLETLDLSYNKLQKVPLETLKEAHSLQSLNLDGNRLTSFEYKSAYDKFKNLRTLTASENNFNNKFYNAMVAYSYWQLRASDSKAQNGVEKPKGQNVTNVVEESTKKNETNVEEVATKKSITNVVKESTKKNETNVVKESTKKNETNVEEVTTKKNETNAEEVTTKKNETNVEEVPKVTKTPVEEEQKSQCIWIWITVPIIVILLVALVWQVMRNRGSDCFGCQPV
ncbi:leucine-rich repeat-containing G-protein coupled receptor 5-like [Drosophila kikkawai]|uniref:Leucine-rich repeat-containing G-protein coupled receptor 5-like n=1 Tax=Drosophila kikkawai TaxID=30033 RepID=A0A6P4IE23_DROKI|nr:leucine-rich repeat transmembrane neuronal protein 4-like [Drosophila kikkawai]